MTKAPLPGRMARQGRMLFEGADGRPVCRWDNMMGRLYTLGLDEDDRTFLGLVLSLLPIGLFTLSAAQDLEERRLQILLRAIVTLSGNDRIAVGTRLSAPLPRGHRPA
ncbi:hypothetical protein [Streptomyces sp. NPDC049915]|uniref:hypothetical protein n=1 Tax=Streptomyces sp. NPDC049915 TaxID=3155510 RepID=UPI0034476D4D